MQSWIPNLSDESLQQGRNRSWFYHSPHFLPQSDLPSLSWKMEKSNDSRFGCGDPNYLRRNGLVIHVTRHEGKSDQTDIGRAKTCITRSILGISSIFFHGSIENTFLQILTKNQGGRANRGCERAVQSQNFDQLIRITSTDSTSSNKPSWLCFGFVKRSTRVPLDDPRCTVEIWNVLAPSFPTFWSYWDVINRFLVMIHQSRFGRLLKVIAPS